MAFESTPLALTVDPADVSAENVTSTFISTTINITPFTFKKEDVCSSDPDPDPVPSVKELGMELSQNGLSISFETKLGTNYAIRLSTTLDGFTILVTLPGTGGRLEYTIPFPLASQAYYKVDPVTP